MDKIELTSQEFEELKDDSYFRGVVVTKLRHIDEKLEREDDTITTLTKKTIWLVSNVRIHWFLISVILIGILGMTWRVLGK